MLLRVIQAIADDPYVGDDETDILEIHMDHMAVGLLQKHRGVHRFGSACGEVPDQVVERVARVQDVLDDQHVMVLKVLSGIHQKPDVSG